MPRGWTPKLTEEERLASIGAETSKLIKIFMIERDIRYDMDLADKVGINRGTFSAKMKNGTWTQKDLCKIVAVLKIPAGDAVKMLGVKS